MSTGCCSPCQPVTPLCTPPPVVVNFGPNPGTVQRLDITSFYGAGPTDLDSIYIEPFVAGTLMQIQIGGAPNPVTTVQKVASSAAPVADLIIRPPDYDASTNAFQWYVIG